MEKIILEIERQIQRLQAAKQLLIETQDSTASLDALSTQMASVPAAPVKRGRGRPRKYPLVLPAAPKADSPAA
jgi:hypothetical protein